MKTRPLLFAAVFLAASLAPAQSSASVSTPSDVRSPLLASALTVSRSVFVPGQSLVFKGVLGSKAKQEVHLQTNMNRPGDTWLDLADSESHTRAHGRFQIRRPAPGMFGISYRAISGRRASGAVLMNPRPQEAILDVASGLQGWGSGYVLAGQPFTVTVDAAPSVGARGQALALPGRTVTLQKRVGAASWQSVGSTTLDTAGRAAFALTAGSAGDVVYRVRLEDWTSGLNQVGWHPSAPTYVHVLDAPRWSRPAAIAQANPANPANTFGALTDTGAKPSAATKYAWGAAKYDFAWELGQSLTSPPSRGTKLRGAWSDFSDGSGRAFIRNGAMSLDSGSDQQLGSLGSTGATLNRAAQRYGRWEARVWVRSQQSGSDMALSFDLVPAVASQDQCGSQTITVAEVAAHSSSVLVGAGAASTSSRWTRTVTGKPINQIFYNYAVEVQKDHITWFIDGKAVATTREPSLLTGIALRPRIALWGTGTGDQNSTQVLADWVRSYSPKSGKTISKGSSLTRGPAVSRC